MCRYDDEAGQGVDELAKVRVQIARPNVLDGRRQQPDGHGHPANRAVETRAAPNAANRHCHIRRSALLELGPALRAQQIVRGLHQLIGTDDAARGLQFAADTRDQRRVGLQMHVARSQRARLVDPFFERRHGAPKKACADCCKTRAIRRAHSAWPAASAIKS